MDSEPRVVQDDIDNLFLIFIYLSSSLFYRSMTKSLVVGIVFIEYLNILFCTESFQFPTFIDKGEDRKQDISVSRIPPSSI